jgi:nucleotide-binding universal stress UspA family protein
MRKVIAALDNSAAATCVVAVATRLADVFGAEVEAVHVGVREAGTAAATAAAAGVELRRLEGPVVSALGEVMKDASAAALVVGTRGVPTGRTVGSTALELITSLDKPIVVVPPDADRRRMLKRVLIPLEGTIATSLAPKGLIELAEDAEIEIVVLHVHDAATIPSFTDQPQHEASAWREEFLARYCPWGIGNVSMHVRVGRRGDEILHAVAETNADLVALGWTQELAVGRAPIVRELLERGRTPVLLLPLRPVSESRAAERRSVWNSLQSSAV